jgi:C-terminal processing protease CtpA/Prc
MRRGENGLVVGTVREDGFFANAGIREGDRILSIDGQTIATEEEFSRLIGSRQGRARVAFMRDGERQEATVNLDDLQAQAGDAENGQASAPKAALGIWFHCYPQGAQVVHVVPGSPAEKAGLRRGDWITSMNGSKWDKWQVVVAEIGSAEPETKAQLQVSREGERMDMEARVADYQEVFADSPNWRQIAAENEYDDQYLTGQAGASRGNQQPNMQQFNTRRDSRGDAQLEQRLRQLEQENADLRRQLQRGSTGTRREGQDTGERINAPPPSPNGQ